MTLTNPNLEAYSVTRGMWLEYYNSHRGSFYAKKKCSGCYNDNLFVIWAVSVAVQAVVDGARIFPELKPLIAPAVDTFRRYKNNQTKGYSAAENSGSDNDVYYDDDAQVASAIITAYEVTGDRKYLDSGRELVRFLMGGWDKKIGGVKWHVSKTYVNACTTAEVAKACLQLSKFIPEEASVYVEFATKCVEWQIEVLQDHGDKCIMDGIQPEGRKIDKVKLTYNTGTTLSAASHLYSITKSNKWKDIADNLAKAAINRNSPFYDRDYGHDKRYWRDPSYWTQLLIEGLADYLLYVGSDVPEDLLQKITLEVERHLKMFYKYLKDLKDGLYIQSFEPHRTFKEIYERDYKRQFGGKKGHGMRGDDKDGDKPQKCLMGLGSAARVFYQGARICPLLQ
ncbi:Six-hairpin glycosidase [Metschnikowia bicuspidata var. bicuspidata NRRL YB-4993]|uniref:Six-hairpin glycosidase n=1 Tax=Metschnikowia bicuspidata var. bicuspidata NRRL YB-4993 TaxID=869754 RepID=A0A1A0H7E0_9ASCO|nr:Six-hairpin glycosidase [Metschnikowia bicuspidata var. bicuspidata NRRL YB-4993]OBA20014.1 Six-hairpin glycosidase [Metschnikowia bicuspidata var. bicuspidata NRRL YB-4993]